MFSFERSPRRLLDTSFRSRKVMSGTPKKSDDGIDQVKFAAGEEDQLPVDDAGTAASPDQQLADLKTLADENWDKYLRAVAELDNVRKRAQRDIDNARKFALERFAGELLAVRDSLELGLTAAENADVAALREGSEATLKLLTSAMQQFGIAEIDPLGEPFDPQVHEAMTVQPSAEAEPGSVLTVFQKGYSLNGRLLRPARVVVATEPVEEA
jgi:molecular chaperone GrpE